MPQDLRRILVPFAFLGGVAAVILMLDANLAGRATSTLEDARSALAARPTGSFAAESSAYRITGVAADLCSALTGTVRGGWMLPRTRRVMRDNPFEVRVEGEGERCRRGFSNHALHFTRRDAPPAASPGGGSVDDEAP